MTKLDAAAAPMMLPAARHRTRQLVGYNIAESMHMEAATSCTGPAPTESDLLVCLAAIGRALHAEFQPRLFLDELSTALRPLVPHDRLDICYLAEDRRTSSVFAEHGAPGFLPRTDRYATDLERAADRRSQCAMESSIHGLNVRRTELARELERTLGDRADVLVVSKDNHLVFTPMLPEVALGALEAIRAFQVGGAGDGGARSHDGAPSEDPRR